ncbi:Pimeloyl-ACP methyl ester carboxylesterase [Raineyella antarctica]|uniref:Pimeloyl-ACP methyl ester carboxylesterase n=1 Tax=Raineyella antarctica TaxID=1577474 RepID=A0A1G6GIN2_9ACTN|nr:alpha/beta hydrolase [Raineyella antarctica]SDB81872.1 Pimeloyl-ACP methyl ester carboxylesterase [Raineyella antarctica]
MGTRSEHTSEHRRVCIQGGELDTLLTGEGEPVLVIPTAVNPYELAPLARLLADTERYRVVQYRRRGSGGSSHVQLGGTIAEEAADAAAILRELGMGRAHVVGASYSSAIALELAEARPDLVHTLTVYEPPPTYTPNAAEFRSRNADLLEQEQAIGAVETLHAFERALDGPEWRTEIERLVPGSVAAIDAEADLFFAHDIPALLAWEFDADRAGRIPCPVLCLRGTTSGPWFQQSTGLLAQWLPEARTVVIEGADHSACLNRAADVAAAILDFMTEHPIG